MRCFNCDRDAYLIRGRCADCDPALHAARADELRRYRDADRMFQAETGKSAIEAWNEFDDFCAARGLS